MYLQYFSRFLCCDGFDGQIKLIEWKKIHEIILNIKLEIWIGLIRNPAWFLYRVGHVLQVLTNHLFLMPKMTETVVHITSTTGMWKQKWENFCSRLAGAHGSRLKFAGPAVLFDSLFLHLESDCPQRCWGCASSTVFSCLLSIERRATRLEKVQKIWNVWGNCVCLVLRRLRRDLSHSLQLPERIL